MTWNLSRSVRTKCSETQMLDVATDWVCLYCMCVGRCGLVFCWLWQVEIFSKLSSCQQTFFSFYYLRIHLFFLLFHLICFRFVFLSFLSLLPHLSGLELLSNFVVHPNLKRKTHIVCCSLFNYQKVSNHPLCNMLCQQACLRLCVSRIIIPLFNASTPTVHESKSKNHRCCAEMFFFVIYHLNPPCTSSLTASDPPVSNFTLKHNHTYFPIEPFVLSPYPFILFIHSFQIRKSLPRGT